MMIPCPGSRRALAERSIVFLVAFGLVRVISCISCIYIYSFECKNMKERLRRPFFSRNNLSLSSICFVPGHDDTMPELKETIVGDACGFLDCLRSCPCHCFVLFFVLNARRM